jgi:hypothetical protein
VPEVAEPDVERLVEPGLGPEVTLREAPEAPLYLLEERCVP